MSTHDYERPRYMISVAAELVGMHPQTLRIYESKGLVRPGRTPGGTRLYSEHDLDRLRLIHRLTTELGLNLAGVSRVIALEDELPEMRARFDRLERRCARRSSRSTASTGATSCFTATPEAGARRRRPNGRQHAHDQVPGAVAASNERARRRGTSSWTPRTCRSSFRPDLTRAPPWTRRSTAPRPRRSSSSGRGRGQGHPGASRRGREGPLGDLRRRAHSRLRLPALHVGGRRRPRRHAHADAAALRIERAASPGRPPAGRGSTPSTT